MPRIDGLLFGYTVFSFDEADAPAVANTLLRLGISAKINKDFTSQIRLSDARRLRKELRGKIDFTETQTLGLPGFLYRNRHRYGTFIGIVIALIILAWSFGAVWDVRISGVDGKDADEILELLREEGLEAGARWSDVDKNKTEAKLLSLSNTAAWVNINRRGTVAYITVKEKDSFEEEKNSPLYSNIVATHDAVIEEITVKNGYVSVEVGDAVRKGDILISGIIPGELGGGFCKAEGTVVGRISERFSVFVSQRTEEKHYVSEKCVNTGYKILGFSINILKNGRNSDAMCDIIENKSTITLFGKYKLPIEKYVTTELRYDIVQKDRTADELVELASSELKELLREELFDSELLKIKTGGGFTDGGYTMYSDVSVLKNIAAETEISVDPKKKGLTDG